MCVCLLFAGIVALCLLDTTIVLAADSPELDKTRYEDACAACHGSDGRGRPQSQLAFETPPPDFSDCEFASREPDPDWFAIIHEGGPVRAFDQMMPAFGDALTTEEIYSILRHVRTFCSDKRWPPGEFNLPRPLFTEKAFVEDETVFSADIDVEGNTGVTTEVLYEKRFGPRSQIEIAVPFRAMDVGPPDDWQFGIGDVVLGFKHNLYHNLEKGTIFSLGGEVIFPTGNEDRGMGGGTFVFEPFAAYGQILPGDSFVQLHAFGEIPTRSGDPNELGLRAAVGKTWTEGPYGRAWTPMIEVLATREFEDGEKFEFDLVPQFQVALNTRQHILLNIGVRIPVTNASSRDTQVVMYLLWDWFDGGFFDGW